MKSVPLILLGVATPLVLAGIFFLDRYMIIPQNGENPLLLNSLLSYPHIIASFTIFYGEREMLKKHSHLGFTFPFILLVLLVWAVSISSLWFLNTLAHLALINFFYHFSMQTFGCSLWLSDKKISTEAIKCIRKVTLSATLTISFTGWVGLIAANATGNVFGMSLTEIPFIIKWAPSLSMLSYLCLAIFLIYLILIARKNSWSLTTFTTVMPVLSLFLWFSPHFINSPLRYAITSLHGLQFLYFYFRVQNVRQEGKWNGLNSTLFFGKWLGLGLIGVLFFFWIPTFIEGHFFGVPAGTSGRIMVAFAIFLNVHH